MWIMAMMAVFGSGGGAWVAVRTAMRLHVQYLSQDVAEAKTMAKEAHQHADKAHDRITGLILQQHKG